ncbi:MAG: hypothetical protein ACD_40C00113G0004 [uncultured bacterium]|uniref:Addiction module toxin RelE n=1 Tax=Candidatus Collierbacteria bacterium RIFOXYD1_FULL_46_26 TaxID=1817732 RepID=A0A1F5FZE4_9BACT|nr:MAG: hypothetical protein ACD_40C00113G0004 [uncultured bacterium]KKU20698.1 MAG: hypothetical protein UX32_C0017G0005 [Microgenomates group bacterium GW2011_GWF1_46_12]OGD84990.1 MAG: hypothetical protein A2618_02620 [Candidatus Collierbacteria bacterium RIFOXYD1_FULL_46_26]
MYQIKYLFDVDAYLDNATESEQRKIVKNLKYLQEYGVRSEVIDLKKLQGYDFWEARITGKNNTRIFCAQKKNIVYILYIFRKKTRKTKIKDLAYGQKQYLLID